jgi:hypothetical protein
MAYGDDTGQYADPSLTVAPTPNFINPAYSTPSQRAQLYAYAQSLMQPQPVKTGWQGLAEIARALVGGYEGHQGDISEQAARANDATQASAVAGQAYSPPGAGAVPAAVPMAAPAAPSITPAPVNGDAGAPQGPAPDPTKYPNTPVGHTSYIRDYSTYRAGNAQNPN